MKMGRLFVIAIAGLALVSAVVIARGVAAPGSVPGLPAVQLAGGVVVQAGAPLPMLQDIEPEDLDPARDVPGVPPGALAPPGRAVVRAAGIRLPQPARQLDAARVVSTLGQ